MDDESVAALCVFFAAVLLRSCVSLHGYSGEGVPPMYGDFEAQRHWMEVTVNLPPRAWYVHGADNDLQYWGLDYPPLSAYLSWVIGLVARWCGLPELVALHDSRGHEPERHVERAISAAPRLAAPLPGAGTGGPGWRSARRRSGRVPPAVRLGACQRPRPYGARYGARGTPAAAGAAHSEACFCARQVGGGARLHAPLRARVRRAALPTCRVGLRRGGRAQGRRAAGLLRARVR